jgi:hypothetical protein
LEPQFPKAPKEKKPPRDRKNQGERKPLREKRPAAAAAAPAESTATEPTQAEGEESGDVWDVSEDAYDPWTTPTEVVEQEASLPKPPKEKRPAADRKPLRDRKPPAGNKSAKDTDYNTPAIPEAETSTSPIQDDASNEKKKSQAYHNPERVFTGGAQRVSGDHSPRS